MDLHDLLLAGYIDSKSLESCSDIRDIKVFVEEKKKIYLKEVELRINQVKASKAATVKSSGEKPPY